MTTRIVCALFAALMLAACTDMSLDGPVMKTTEAQALPPYHMTQSFSAQN